MNTSSDPVRIGLIGEYRPTLLAHRAIQQSLAALTVEFPGLEWCWICTDALTQVDRQLADFDGLWCVPGSPYRHFNGAIAAIAFARTTRRSFLGTCGGFQHAVVEYARNVMGLRDAQHAEEDAEAPLTVITPLRCTLIEKSDRIELTPGSLVHQICATVTLQESYHCSYGIDPQFERQLDTTSLKITGRDVAGDARVVELRDHPFYLATLFQPERAALQGAPHNIVRAFISSAHSSNHRETPN